jgi:cation transport ATPase
MTQMTADHAHHDHGGSHDHRHDLHDHESPVECCSHHELEIERYIILYLVGGMLALTSWIAGLAEISSPLVTILPAVLGAIMLALPLFKASFEEIFIKHRISSSSLAALAILAAIAAEQYVTAALLAFILLVADQVLRRTAFGAQRAIEELVG